jgi:hypothetical protein
VIEPVDVIGPVGVIDAVFVAALVIGNDTLDVIDTVAIDPTIRIHNSTTELTSTLTLGFPD